MKSSVKIEIYGSRERYWGYVRFTDREGTEHVRTAAGKREDSVKSNTLQALIECLKLLIRPCMVDVYTKMDEIIEPFKQGWFTTGKRMTGRMRKDGACSAQISGGGKAASVRAFCEIS